MADDRKTSSSAFISLDEGGSARPPRPGTPRRGVIAAIAALACAVLIVASLGFVHPGADGGWSLAWLFQTTAASEAPLGSGAEDAAPDAQGSDANGDAHNDVAAGGGSAAQPEGGGGASSSAANSQSSGGPGAGANTSGDTPSTDTPNHTSPSPQQPATITVKVSVDSSAVGSPVSASATVTLESGATAFDALKALGISYNAQGSQFGVYVSAIGGLAEKEHGSTSGWIYLVNGSMPNTAASSYELSDGDAVRWVYSVSE